MTDQKTEQEHTCHDMNPPHPYPCAACESEKLEGPAGGAREDATEKSSQSTGTSMTDAPVPLSSRKKDEMQNEELAHVDTPGASTDEAAGGKNEPVADTAASKSLRWQRKHKQEGLCVLCSKPAIVVTGAVLGSLDPACFTR